MRHIGNLPDEGQAQTFHDYALTRGIRTQIELENTQWAVWVYEEDQVPQARQELHAFQEEPQAALYREAAAAAAHIRRDEELKNRRAKELQVDVQRRWQRPLARRAPVTVLLIALSVMASLGSNFGDRVDPVVRWLGFAKFIDQGDGQWYWLKSDSGVDAILAGEVWRLITPIFLHLGPLHLLFNMYWTWTFGTMIESRRGSWRMAGMVLLIAAGSNFLQWLVSGPSFGGMSGVGYGLFGYLWAKSRLDPWGGWVLSQNLVFFFLLWFVLCLTGVVGPVANTAHFVGLVIGGALGAARPLVKRHL